MTDFDYENAGLCPVCRSDDTESMDISSGKGELYQYFNCLNCGVAWDVMYRAMGISKIVDSKGRKL